MNIADSVKKISADALAASRLLYPAPGWCSAAPTSFATFDDSSSLRQPLPVRGTTKSRGLAYRLHLAPQFAHRKPGLSHRRGQDRPKQGFGHQRETVGHAHLYANSVQQEGEDSCQAEKKRKQEQAGGKCTVRQASVYEFTAVQERLGAMFKHIVQQVFRGEIIIFQVCI